MDTTVKVISGRGFTPAEIQFGLKVAKESGLRAGQGCYQWNEFRQFDALSPEIRIHSTHCDYCRNAIAAMRRYRQVCQEKTKVMTRKISWWKRVLNFFGF